MSIINLLLGNKESKISIDIPHYSMKYNYTSIFNETQLSFGAEITFYINNISILKINSIMDILHDDYIPDIQNTTKGSLKRDINEIKKFSEALKLNKEYVLDDCFLLTNYRLSINDNLLTIINNYWSEKDDIISTFSETCIKFKLSLDNRKELAESFLNLCKEYTTILDTYDKFIKLKDDL